MSIFKRLQPKEITITPFKAHKKYTPTIDNIDSSSGVIVTEGVNYDGHFYTAEEKNTNGIYKRTVYHLVNKLHYKFEYDPAQTITNNTREVLEKNFVTNAEDVPFPTHQSASITHICIPQEKFGERIKPGTVQITSKSGSLNGEIYLDDKLGNLYNSSISSSWESTDSSSYWPPSSSLKGYWKFDDASEPYIDYSGNGNHAHHTGSDWTTYYDTSSVFDGLAIKTNNSIGGTTGMSGVRLAKHRDLTNQNKQTWTLWFKPDGHNDASSQARIISRDLSEYFGLRENGAYDSNGKCDITVTRGNGATNNHTNALISGSWHFAAFSIDYTEQKQSFYLWNGEQWFENKNATTGGVSAWNGNNNPQERNRMVILGANSERETDIHMNQTANNLFSGSYDEVRYYDTNLSEEQIYTLKDFPRGAKESFVGDVWYNQGEIVVKTMGQHKNLALGTGSAGFDLEWDATVKIHEHEYRCTAEVDEFNKTINRSIIAESLNNDKLIGTASHSLFSPYVTTIGLYDQNYALLAVGKLARPIKTSTETPITFVVRLDF
tara:strand:+ start:7222 stop:8865 length:1644 start_codon:yes stop_codon:yes gene_type:complete